MSRPLNNNLLLELHIPDFDVAKDFYGKLGFKERVEDPITEEYCGYLTMQHEDPAGNTLLAFYGGDEKVFNQSYFKGFPKDTKRGYAVELTVPLDDVRKKYELVQSMLSEFVVQELKEVRDHELMWLDFRMVDPFGFYLRFTDLLDWGQG